MTGPRWYRIVVALDLSEYAEIVLEHALDQAARHGAPDLHFVTVQEARGAPLDELKSRLAALVYQGLALFPKDGPNWRARLHVRTGRADEQILELADEVNADLIVLGRFGVHRGARFGTIANRVASAAPCPTLVVGLGERAPAAEGCADCVAVREESDGERWFCAAHSAPDRAGLATFRVPLATDFTGGGPMW